VRQSAVWVHQLSEDSRFRNSRLRLKQPNDGSRHGHNSTDAAANRAKDEEANRNLASIRPFFIVKDLQVSISYYIDASAFSSTSRVQATTRIRRSEPGWHRHHAQGDPARRASTAKPHRTNGLVGTRTSTPEPDALFDEFSQRGASFVKKLSFIDEGLWALSHRCRRVCPCFLHLRRD